MWLLLACSGGADTAPQDGAVPSVSGPDIDIDPWVVAVGTLAPGAGTNASLIITNRGGENLDLTAMTLQAPVDGLSEELIPIPVYIVPGGELSMLFPVGPSAAGSFTGDYVFHSNDPDEPTVTVQVQWTVSEGG